MGPSEVVGDPEYLVLRTRFMDLRHQTWHTSNSTSAGLQRCRKSKTQNTNDSSKVRALYCYMYNMST